jgi:hypothetical protein
VRVTTEETELLAHCTDPTCLGYEQQPVAGVRELVERLYGDADPDAGLNARIPENSYTYLRFADEADRDCPACGRTRELSDQRRPNYDGFSGYRSDFLVQVQKHGGVEKAMAEMTRENQRLAKLAGEFQESEKAAAGANQQRVTRTPRAKVNTDGQ